MESLTIQKVRVQLQKAIEEQKTLKEQYKSQKRATPFDQYTLASLRMDIESKTKEIFRLRVELESYQLEFLFGA